MKSEQELEGFYNSKLLPDLEALEVERKAIAKRFWMLLLLFFVLAGAGAAFAGLWEMFEVAIGCGIAAVVMLVVMLIMHHSKKGKFVHKFKNVIVNDIVKFVGPELNYHPKDGINIGAYMQSTIYPRRPDRYVTEDLVTGMYGDTHLAFSEVHSQYKTTTVNHKGQTRTTWHTIFDGVFFIADFNKHFKGRTVVLPDTMEKMFGRLGKFFQKMNFSRPPLVKLEDPEFEKHFAVYGDDQVETRYILSTSLMQRIVDFRSKTSSGVALSFVGSHVYVAIPITKNLFEPNLFKTNINFNLIKEYYYYLWLAIGIVEDLNLNTRIWTKE